MGFSIGESYGSVTWEPLPTGWHLAYVTQCIPGKSKKGQEMLTFRFNVMGGSKFDGRHVKAWPVLVPENYGYGFIQKILFGIDPDIANNEASKDAKDRFDPHNPEKVSEYLMGQPLWMKIEHNEQTWEGKTRVQERAVDFKSLSDEDKGKLQDLYGEGEGYLVPPLPQDAWNGLPQTF